MLRTTLYCAIYESYLSYHPRKQKPTATALRPDAVAFVCLKDSKDLNSCCCEVMS